MKIILSNDRDTDFTEQLLNVWERSVKVTHLFLTNEAIEEIKRYVPQAIGFYEHMGFRTYKRTDTDEQGMPYPLLYMRL